MGEKLPFRRRLKSLDEYVSSRGSGRGRRGTAGLPRIWSPYLRRGWRHPAAEIRMMIWIGLLIGLLAFQALRLLPAGTPENGPAVRLERPADPFAEARRSRAILEAQEGAPAPVAVESRRGRPSAPPYVIDGDTFDYGGNRIRIADIDTPEVRGACAYESRLAVRATERIRALLSEGPFELQPLPDGRDVDRFGRKLRIVTRGGRSLGDQLVAEGLARTWTGRRQPWC